MKEINQLARAELAHKHSLRVIAAWEEKPYIWNTLKPSKDMFDNKHLRFAVHPDDEAKLDAIIWEGARDFFTEAYLNQHGEIVFSTMRASGWELIATRELPNEKPEIEHMHMISHDEARLFADIKEFVSLSDKYINKTAVHQARYYKEIGSRAKDLLERINPKPVCKCCGQVLEKKND